MFQSNLVMLMLNLKNAFQVDLKFFPTFMKYIRLRHGLSAMLINTFPVATP